MGRNNQQRRAAKKRERDRRRRARDAGSRSRPGKAAPSGSAQRTGHAPPGGWDDRYCWYHQRWQDDSLPSTGEPAGCDPLAGDGWPDDEDGTEWFDGDGPYSDGDGWDGDGIGWEGDGPYGDGDGWEGDGPIDVRGLLTTAAARPHSVEASRAVMSLALADNNTEVWLQATAELTAALDSLYEHGWQPADLMHIATKKLDSAGQLLVARTIQYDAMIRDTEHQAPEEWCVQVHSITGTHGPQPSDGSTAIEWLIAAHRLPLEAWRDVVGALAMMSHLPPLQALLDPPSRWPRDGSARPGRGPSSADGRRPRSFGDEPPVSTTPRGDHDPKMLARIRALLAKAESTEFPQEAEALTGKAQALMSRYAIDEAVLDDGASKGSPGSGSPGPDVRARRMHVESPYASAKVQLLAAVGAANRVRVIWHGDVDMATAVGFPLELDLVEMLYTSLLVQATRAMTDAGRRSSGDRSKSFRRAFLLAYAQRVGERLSRANADETADAAGRTAGADLVLARRGQEVDDAFDRLFPRSRKMRSTRVDARGWHAGRDAADRATIARGRLDPGGGTGPR